MIWIALKWLLIVAGVSLGGILFLLAWDWLFWRRIPHVRWRMSQSGVTKNEINIIREITRMRRIKQVKGPSSNGPVPPIVPPTPEETPNQG